MRAWLVAATLPLVGCGRIGFDEVVDVDAIPDLVTRYSMDSDAAGGTVVADNDATFDGTCVAVGAGRRAVGRRGRARQAADEVRFYDRPLDASEVAMLATR